MLTQEQVKRFQDEGMLCIPDFLSPDQIAQLSNRAHTLLDDFDPLAHQKTLFSTSKDNHVGNQYFLDSLDKVSFFFDTDAVDNDGNLVYPKQVAINKIGHGLHLHEPAFEKVTFDDKVQDIARSLEYKDPRVLQSMLIFKHPAQAKKIRDNEVPPHQDGTFLYTDPPLALGFWFALEDVTKDNGCLYYAPGSHKKFPIISRFVRTPKAPGTEMMGLADVHDPEPRDSLKYVPMECKAGSLILIHNQVLHKLEKNESDKLRFAYAFHLIEGTADYDEFNWLQVPSLGGTNFSKLFKD